MGGLSKSKSRTSTTQMDPRFPEQQQIWGAIMPYILQGLQGGVPRFPGQMYQPTTEAEQAYMDQISGLRTGALSDVFQGNVPYEVGPEWAEKYYSESIKPMAMREFSEITLPQIKGSFAGPGYYGSARALTESKAGYDLATDLASARAQLLYGEELASRQAKEAAVGRQMQAEQWAANEQYRAGELQRTIGQEQIASELQRWLSGEQVEGQQNWAYNPYIQLAFALLGLEGMQTGQTSSSSSSGMNISGGK